MIHEQGEIEFLIQYLKANNPTDSSGEVVYLCDTSKLPAIPREKMTGVIAKLKTTPLEGPDGYSYPIPYDNPHSSCALRTLYTCIFLHRWNLPSTAITVIGGTKHRITLESDLWLHPRPVAEETWHQAIVIRVQGLGLCIIDLPFFDEPIPLDEWLFKLGKGERLPQKDYREFKKMARKYQRGNFPYAFYMFSPAFSIPKDLSNSIDRTQQFFQASLRRTIDHSKTIPRNHLMRLIRQCTRLAAHADPARILPLIQQYQITRWPYFWQVFGPDLRRLEAVHPDIVRKIRELKH